MTESTRDRIATWSDWGLRYVMEILVGFIVFFASQINSNVNELRGTLETMRDHGIKTDERITKIESSRSEKLAVYERFLEEFEAMKTQMVKNTVILSQIEVHVFRKDK